VVEYQSVGWPESRSRVGMTLRTAAVKQAEPKWQSLLTGLRLRPVACAPVAAAAGALFRHGHLSQPVEPVADDGFFLAIGRLGRALAPIAPQHPACIPTAAITKSTTRTIATSSMVPSALPRALLSITAPRRHLQTATSAERGKVPPVVIRRTSQGVVHL
jgi:hypothetical protein